MNTKDIQKQFLSLIEQDIAPRNLVDELAEILNVASSSIYRRIKGDTAMPIEDLLKILHHYPNISFEKLVRPYQIPYDYASLMTESHTMFNYLNKMEHDLQQIARFPKAKIAYAAQELPFFHYLLVPELAVFKFYVWNRTVWHADDARQEPFQLAKYQHDTALQNQIHRVASLYASIHSEEVWNSNMLDMTLNQIRHSYYSGHFTHREDIIRLFKALRVLIEQLHKMVSLGQKNMANKAHNRLSSLQVWYNELIHNSSFILVQLTFQHRMVYNVLDAPNFMRSKDRTAYDYCLSFFERMKNYALPLCEGINERHSELFFRRLEQKVDLFEKEIAV